MTSEPLLKEAPASPSFVEEIQADDAASDRPAERRLGLIVLGGILGALGATLVEGFYFLCWHRLTMLLGPLCLLSAWYMLIGLVLGLVMAAWVKILERLKAFPLLYRCLQGDGPQDLRFPVAKAAIWLGFAIVLALSLSLTTLDQTMVSPLSSREHRMALLAFSAALVFAALSFGYRVTVVVLNATGSGVTSAKGQRFVRIASLIVVTCFGAVLVLAAHHTAYLPLRWFLVAFAFVGTFLGARLLPMNWSSRAVGGSIAAATLWVVISPFVFGSPQIVHLLRSTRSMPDAVLWGIRTLQFDPCHQELRRRLLRARDGADRQEIPEPREATAPRLVDDRPDILLITIDTLRTDRFASGPGAPPSGMASLAADGTVFSHAFTAAPATIGALTQIITGRPWHTLQLLAAPGYPAPLLHPDMPTIATRLGKSGYATRATFSSGLLAYYPPLGRGFDRVEERSSMELIVDQVLEQAYGSRQPRFTWAHVLDIHVHRFGDSVLQSDYDSLVHRIDAQLSRLLTGLRRSPRWSHTLVIVTADHGESLGEAGFQAHGISNARVAAIPLVIHFPDGAPAGQVNATVGQLDLAPTICAAAGLPLSEFPGRDLATLRGGGAAPATFSFHETGEADPGEFGVVAYPWMFTYDVRTKLPVLINLELDPDGLLNQAGKGIVQERTLSDALLRSL